jgi:TolA-binding protein
MTYEGASDQPTHCEGRNPSFRVSIPKRESRQSGDKVALLLPTGVKHFHPATRTNGAAMKKTLWCFVFAMFLALSGCSNEKAKTIYETAELEELQRNYDHAIELYRELIKKYPESAYAEKATDRLGKLIENVDNL